MNHPGGQTLALVGAYTVQAKPVHLRAGTRVREDMVLPCVLEAAGKKYRSILNTKAK
jgi:hypothetical protein